MAVLHLLGTGAAAISHRTTTMLAFEGKDYLIAVDCGGDLIHQMVKSNIDPLKISLLIISHEHPDHVGGFPLFIEKMWLSGREEAIHVAGPKSALDQAKTCFNIYNTEKWLGLPEVIWHEVELEEDFEIWDSDSVRISSTPGDHGVPCIGLKVENKKSNKVVAYSCDTKPSEEIAMMANNADIFLHEATGAGPVHSSILEAASIGAKASAQKLILVHLPPQIDEEELEQARKIHDNIILGEDSSSYDF